MAMQTSTSAIPAQEQAELIELSKKAAARQAVKDHLEHEFRYVGIGSGSTVIHVVQAIAELGPDITSRMTFYPTGDQSRDLIEEAKLNLGTISQLSPNESLDVCFDGADEVDEDLNLIKGGGACLWQEKIVVASAKKFICVVDYRKIAARLGTAWKQGIPIEVNPEAVPRVLKELQTIGSINPVLRTYEPAWRKAQVVTDNHQALIDAPFPPLLLARDAEANVPGKWTVDGLARRLKEIVGVAEIGIFSGAVQKPVAVYIGLQDGTTKSLQLKA